jgi:tripartite-type tricarboxylate transporter receptor subunit TctC
MIAMAHVNAPDRTMKDVTMVRVGSWLAVWCVAVAVALFSGGTFAQSGKTVRLVVPVPPGASTDAVARLMAEQIGRAQGVTFVVENRPGASGMIGTEQVSRAAPDGTSLLMTANTYLIDAQTRKANYHPVTAFEPICYLVQSPAVFVVNSASPYKTLKDLLDAARLKPGELSMAAVGPGSTFQMGFTAMTKAAGVTMTYVPYAGSAPAVTAVMGQHVTSAFAGYAVVAENVKADKLRALGVATAKRVEPLLEVPTFDEQGFKNLEVDNWFGVVAPAHTPKETIAQLSGWFKAALQETEVKAKLALQGLYPVGQCGDEFAAYIRKRFDDYGAMIKESNIKTE